MFNLQMMFNFRDMPAFQSAEVFWETVGALGGMITSLALIFFFFSFLKQKKQNEMLKNKLLKDIEELKLACDENEELREQIRKSNTENKS